MRKNALSWPTVEFKTLSPTRNKFRATNTSCLKSLTQLKYSQFSCLRYMSMLVIIVQTNYTPLRLISITKSFKLQKTSAAIKNKC